MKNSQKSSKIMMLNFLKSALTKNSQFHTLNEVKKWLANRNKAIKVSVEQIPFSAMDSWFINREKGVIQHKSGKFFTIEGINVKTNWGKVHEWNQPIINQPEVGYLGIITKEFKGILYFLLQAKVEPGNVNNVQLSPTLQATRSNYSQVHKGKKPLYLEYFQNVKPDEILLDQLQSEQGARFLRKRNRNIILKTDKDVEVHDDFIWLTLGQIKELVKNNNLINMDTRTVISGIPYGEFDNQALELIYALNYETQHKDFEFDMLKSSVDKVNSLFSFDEILNWLTALKCTFDLEISPKSIFDINGWSLKDSEIVESQNRFFKVIASKVSISNREVTSWTQPLVQPIEHGIIAFIIKKINGIFHFLVQAKLEPGNFDIIELAPTVQCITGSYSNARDVPFLEYILQVDKSRIRHDTLQSEEGGRFFREQNRNLIVEVDEQFPTDVPKNYKWVTLNQLNIFLKFNNYLNIQSRSLISTISFI